MLKYFVNVANYEDSLILKQICNYTKVNLSECRRSNRVLFDLCDNLNKVKQYGFKSRSTMFNIVQTNRLRKHLNYLCMDKYI